MFINKIGYHHSEYGENNQDYGIQIEDGNYSVICDGCGSGKHSEVGAKLFCIKMEQNINTDIYNFNSNMKEILNVFKTKDDNISKSIVRNFLSFTTIGLDKRFLYNFHIEYSGDGYIILQDYEDNITFVELETVLENEPEYLIYSIIDEKNESVYENCQGLKFLTYSKEIYKNAGISSDGLRFIFGSPIEQDFINALKDGKENKIKRLINMNSKIFQDDITISF